MGRVLIRAPEARFAGAGLVTFPVGQALAAGSHCEPSMISHEPENQAPTEGPPPTPPPAPMVFQGASACGPIGLALAPAAISGQRGQGVRAGFGVIDLQRGGTGSGQGLRIVHGLPGCRVSPAKAGLRYSMKCERTNHPAPAAR